VARIWYCVNCGYEVERGGRCHNCKAPLTASPLAELAEGEVDDELGYRLNDWDDEERGQLIHALVEAGIRHRFEDDELVVSAADEEQVDHLMSEVSAVPTSRDGDDEARDVKPLPDEPPDPAMLAAVTALYDAAQRLRLDPTDMVADTDVAEASAAMFSLNHVYGVDADTWAAIGRVTRRLLGALGAEMALEDEIAGQAAILGKLLEPLLETPEEGESGDAGEASDESGEAEGDADELVYELDDWLPEERAQLELFLERDDVGHEWEGPDLIVASEAQERLDALFDQVDRSGSDELPAEEGDDEAEYMALNNLFGAADRLAGDPDNKNRRAQLIEAADVISGWSIPFGMTDDQWWRIRGQAKALRDSVEGDAPSVVVADGAIALRDVLRQFV
jgi:hypothetical protein